MGDRAADARAIIRDGDLADLARLSGRLWHHLPGEYGRELLERVAGIPTSELGKHPRILVSSYLASQLSEDPADATLRRVIDVIRAMAPRYANRLDTYCDAEDVVEAGTAAVIGARIAGDLVAAEVVAVRTQARLDALAAPEGAPWRPAAAGGRPGWLTGQRAVTALLAGDDDQAVRYATAAFHEAGPAPYHNWSGPASAAHLALLAAVRGHRELAEEWLGRLHQKGRVHPLIEHLTLLPAELARAHLAMDRLDADAAARDLESAGAATEPVELWPFVAHARARFDLLFGDPHVALVQLDEARFAHGAGAGQLGLGGFVLARARAELLAELGDSAELDDLVRRFPEAGTLQVAVARGHLLRGRWSASVEAVERGLPGASPRDAIELRTIAAAALLHLGEQDLAVQRFEIVLATRGGDDNVAVFATIDADDAVELAALAQHGDPYPRGVPVRARRRLERRAAISVGPAPEPGSIARPRITRQFDEGSRIVLLSGEGGAGKTALAAEWVQDRRDRGHRAVWLQLDSAARTRESMWRRALMILDEHGRLHPDGELARFAVGELSVDAVRGLIVELLYQYGRPVRIVIDELHQLSPEAAADVVWVLERASQVIVVATSRGGTPLDDANVLARLGGRIIRTPELALTPLELRELAEREGVALHHDELQQVLDLTRGNVRASRIALAAIARGARRGPVDLEQLTTVLGESMGRELLPEFTGEADRAAALRLSLVPGVDDALAARLTGRSDIAQLLDAFQDQGLGERRAHPTGPVFSFHALARHILRREAKADLDPEECRRLLRLAAEHAEQAGQALAAIELLVEARAFDAVWPAVVRNFSELATHRVDEMIELLGRVPADDLAAHGTLGIALAIMLSERESVPSTRIRRLVEAGLQSMRRLPPPSDDAERHLRLLAEFGALRASRQYERAADVGQAVAAQQRRLGGVGGDGVGDLLPVGLMQVLITDTLAGRFSAAVSHGNELAHDHHPGRSMHRLAVLAETSALEGDMRAAARFADSLPQQLTEQWRGSLYATGWHLARALLALEAGDPGAASEAMDPVERLELTEHWPYALWTQGLIRLAAGQAQLGLDELALALRGYRGRGISRYASELLVALRADLALASGDLSSAVAVLPERSTSAAVTLARARVVLADGDPLRALRVIQGVDWSTATARHSSESLLLTAVIHHREGNQVSAEFSAARGAGILRRVGLGFPLVMVPRRELRALGVEVPATIGALADPFAALAGIPSLSPRERAVLGALEFSGSTARIAEELHVSQNTVKTQLRSVYRKLGVSSRGEAVREAKRRGLLRG